MSQVVAYDPVAMPNAREQLAGNSLVTLAPSARDAAEGADALAVITEWLEFRSPDFDWLARTLRGKALFDGRNLYEPSTVRAAGLSLLRHRTGVNARSYRERPLISNPFTPLQ